MLIPLGWWVCVSLLAPARAPEQAGTGPRGQPAPPTGSAVLGATLDRYFAAAAAGLDSRPASVLAGIPNRERRALAVVHYLKRHDQVDIRWVWTAEEARSHRLTPRYRRAITELRRVRRAFAELNPGYTLVTDTNARPLHLQVRYWNRERSVALAGRELQDSARQWLIDEEYPDVPDSVALARFLDRVIAYRPARLPTVAVPGLSLHGQLRAFDFAVLRRGRVVAGTSSATIDSVWRRGGWAERLRAAVSEAGGDLTGPMETPPEPWHYEYRPETP